MTFSLVAVVTCNCKTLKLFGLVAFELELELAALFFPFLGFLTRVSFTLKGF